MAMKKYSDFKSESGRTEEESELDTEEEDLYQTETAFEETLQQLMSSVQRDKQIVDESINSHNQLKEGEYGDIGAQWSDLIRENDRMLNTMFEPSGSGFKKPLQTLDDLDFLHGQPKMQRQDSMHRRKKSRYSEDTERKTKPSRAKKLHKSNSKNSWIYMESSWSEGTDEENICSTEREKFSSTLRKPEWDVSFRDYVMKELLKQGKGLKWYIKGTKKAIRKIDKLPPEEESNNLKHVSSQSREVSDFLIKSSRPFYMPKKKRSAAHWKNHRAKGTQKQIVRNKQN